MQAITRTPAISNIEPRPVGSFMPEGKDGIEGGLWLGRVLGLVEDAVGVSRFSPGLCRRGASAFFRGAPSERCVRRRRWARTVGFLSGSELCE